LPLASIDDIEAADVGFYSQQTRSSKSRHDIAVPANARRLRADRGDSSARWTMCTILQSGCKVEPGVLTRRELSNGVSKEQDLVVQGCLYNECQRLPLSDVAILRKMPTIENKPERKNRISNESDRRRARDIQRKKKIRASQLITIPSRPNTRSDRYRRRFTAYRRDFCASCLHLKLAYLMKQAQIYNWKATLRVAQSRLSPRAVGDNVGAKRGHKAGLKKSKRKTTNWRPGGSRLPFACAG